MKKTLSALLVFAYFGILLNFNFFIAFDSNHQNLKSVWQASQDQHVRPYLDLRIKRLTDPIIRFRKPVMMTTPHFSMSVLFAVIFVACGKSSPQFFKPFLHRPYFSPWQLRAPPTLL